VRALSINRLFWELRKHENRQLFLEHVDEAFHSAGLTKTERAMVQGLIRVPLIWQDPAVESLHGGRAVESLVSSIDLAPSLLERAGLAPYEGMQGRSFVPRVQVDAAGRSHVLIEYDRQRILPLTGPRVHTLVTKRWRLSLWRDLSEGELFDLEQDPLEFWNLWSDPACIAIRAKLLDVLARADGYGRYRPAAYRHCLRLLALRENTT